MPRVKAGGIVIKDGRMNARVTYTGTDGKRHAIWRAAKNKSHARQLIHEIIQMLGNGSHGRMAPAKQAQHGFVYALRMEVEGVNSKPIKIGFSVSVSNRTAALITGSPYPVTLLGYWETHHGDREERDIHKRFAFHRMRGEWFHPVPALLLLIDERVTKYKNTLAERHRELTTLTVI